MFGFDLSGLLLLGQVAPPGEGGPMGFTILIPVLLILVAGLAIVIGLPVWLGIRHATKERELEHLERMKALELGRPFPGDRPPEPPRPRWTPARVSVAIGAGVPIAAFALSWMAVMTAGAPGEFVYPSAAGVSITAVICGTILAARIPWNQETTAHAKPPFDAEAYDLSGHHA